VAGAQAEVAGALAGGVNRAPRDVAAELGSHLVDSDLLETVEVSGPGFINLTLRDDWIAAEAARQLGDPRLDVPAADPAQRIVVDYSAPNVAREMHGCHPPTTILA